jgi:branched-chain amino acid transport system substrate-binding protein
VSENDKEHDSMNEKSVSRRDFLKIAGTTGAAISLAGGLGGLIAACGEEETTTTTAATAGPTTTAAAGTTTTAAMSTTTVSAGAEAGRPIKIGVLSPKTGAIASFAQPDEWIVNNVAASLKDGVICGDNKLHTFEFQIEDTQSKSDRSAQVAGDLIAGGIDMILASSSPENVNPAADQCEAFGVPLLATFVPWQPFYLGRQKDPANPQPFKWTWMYHFGLEDAAEVRIGLWQQVETNKKVGLLFPNDSDGTAWANDKTGLSPKLIAAGYEITQPGLHEASADDFTQQISEFKKNGCEIVSGIETPPVFTNFWKQSIQQGYRPKIAWFGKALLFHQTLIALGDSGIGLSDEVVWHPTFPYKSSLSGQTCQELADQYSADTGEGWTEPLGQYGKFEWMVDIYKRMTDIDDKEQFPTLVAQTKMDTIQGHVDFTLPVEAGTVHPVPNVFKIRIAAGQWIKTEGGKWPYDLVLGFANGPEIPTPAKLQPMQYA